jgi:hypothetical protein
MTYLKGKGLRDNLRQALRIFGHHIRDAGGISVRGTPYRDDSTGKFTCNCH